MQSVFPCFRCGVSNAMGQPYCVSCGQVFAYNCPYCNQQVDNRYANCPNCRALMNWPAGAQGQQSYPHHLGAGQSQYAASSVGRGERKNPWVMIIMTVLVIAVVAVLIWFFTSPKGQPGSMPPSSQQQLPAPGTTDNTFDSGR